MKYLPRVAKDKDNVEARRQLLYISVVLELSGILIIFLDWLHLLPVSGLVMLAFISVTA